MSLVERIVEIVVRVRCDGCRRVEGEFRRKLSDAQVLSIGVDSLVRDELRSAELRFGDSLNPPRDRLTGDAWSSTRAGAHLCPTCRLALRALGDP